VAVAFREAFDLNHRKTPLFVPFEVCVSCRAGAA